MSICAHQKWKDYITLTIREHHILYALEKKHRRNDSQFWTHVKNGPTHSALKGELLIIDGLAMAKSWANPCLTGYEVKTSRADYLQDNKWHLYRPYCHQLYLVCPKGLIQPSEVPEWAGLMWYNHDKRSITTRRKAVRQNIEMSSNMLYYILMSKLESDRHPFFSGAREQLEELVNDKRDTQLLSKVVQTKLLKENNDLRKQVVELKAHESNSVKLTEVCAVLDEHKLKSWYWPNTISNLQQALSGKEIHPQKINELKAALTKANSIVQEMGGNNA